MAEMLDTSLFELPWETLDAIIEGKSPVDLNSVPVHTREEAAELVFQYGYDLKELGDQEEIRLLFQEAVNFIENRLLTDAVDWHALEQPHSPCLKIPKEVIGDWDVQALILLAASTKKPDKLWACAILKVLHTLVHIHNNPTLMYFQEAGDSILSRFQSMMIPQEDGSFSLVGSKGRVLNLYAFETKHKKPRESILIKLLCKKETVAEDVWDLVGVRMVTQQVADAILAIELLREKKMILFSNVVPSRSKNNLIEFESFRTQYEKMMTDIKMGKKQFESIQALFRSIPVKRPTDNDFHQNPMSLPDYRSLHITCRHFIRVQTNIIECDDDNTFCRPVKQHRRIAFPYEIQIVDKESYLQNKAGKTSHSLYKQKQLVAARRRVLGRLLTEEYRALYR